MESKRPRPLRLARWKSEWANEPWPDDVNSVRYFARSNTNKKVYLFIILLLFCNRVCARLWYVDANTTWCCCCRRWAWNFICSLFAIFLVIRVGVTPFVISYRRGMLSCVRSITVYCTVYDFGTCRLLVVVEFSCVVPRTANKHNVPQTLSADKCTAFAVPYTCCRYLNDQGDAKNE